MNRIRRFAIMLAGLAAALVAAVAVAPAALAMVVPPPGPVSRFEQIAPPLHHTHTAVSGGMAGGQIVLIAVGAALLAALLAVTADRTRTARRAAATTA
jgi:hypothetical protein